MLCILRTMSNNVWFLFFASPFCFGEPSIMFRETISCYWINLANRLGVCPLVVYLLYYSPPRSHITIFICFPHWISTLALKILKTSNDSFFTMKQINIHTSWVIVYKGDKIFYDHVYLCLNNICLYELFIICLNSYWHISLTCWSIFP